MIDMPNPENREKVASIIALYNHKFSETVRYRDMEWKITALSVGLLAGIVTAIKWFSPPNVSCSFRIILSALALAITAYSCWHLHYVHRRLTEERRRCRKIEDVLGFFSSGIYDKDSILPPSWAGQTISYAKGIIHLVSWWLLIIAVSVSVIYYIGTTT
jgi:hypothetical protein